MFIPNMGFYCFKRLFHGINNSFEKFQRAIKWKLGVFSEVKFIFEDIIIFNESLNESLNNSGTIVFQNVGSTLIDKKYETNSSFHGK